MAEETLVTTLTLGIAQDPLLVLETETDGLVAGVLTVSDASDCKTGNVSFIVAELPPIWPSSLDVVC